MSWKYIRTLQERLKVETGHIIKDWGGKMSVALIFPNTYFVGMSNLGFQTAYELFNALSDVVCERVFYPESEEALVLSVESQKPLSEFDILAFSVPFEMDYSQVLEILLRSGIPLRSEERSELHPIVALGGITAFLNPQPLSPFVDFFFLGEAEMFTTTFRDFFRDHRLVKLERRKWLEDLARSIPGIYVPLFYRESYKQDGTIEEISPLLPALPERVFVQKSSLEATLPARTRIFTPDTEFSNAFLVEIGRGCGRGCRFCAAGYIYRPPRFHRVDNILRAVPETEFPKRWGLVSAAVGDYPYLEELSSFLIGKGVEISFSSLRVDGIKPIVKEIFKRSQHHAVAIAPEAGSERLRRVINKKLSDDQIYEACVTLTEAGIRHLKLYFMIGLPTETDEDVEAIASLAKGVRHEVIRAAKGVKNLGSIVVNVNAFVPKPFTPFQWVPFDEIGSLKRKIKKLQNLLKGFSNLRVHFDVPKWAYLQALFARGDRRVSMLIEKKVKDRLGWSDSLRHMPWNPDFFVMREREKEERFPWEIVDHGIDKDFLWREYEAALAGKESPGCFSKASCNLCGVCEKEKNRNGDE
ncbi:MAG: radical SAM protein [Syntrophobacterales bacterium]|nr:radical SAM protein [Syntrophobacterales bacterium]